MDISNFQPEGSDLVNLINLYGVEHVIVRLPQRVESHSLYERAVAQVNTVLSAGKTLGGYGWLYRDEPIAQQVEDWYSFLFDVQVSVPIMWIDVEPYKTNDNLPSIAQIKACDIVVADHGRGGMYSGPWVWSLLRNVADDVLSTRPLWTAEYNGRATLSDVTLYGGWTSCAGHQYQDSPVDLSVFEKQYTV